MITERGWAGFLKSISDALGTADLRRLQLAWTASSIGGWVFFIALAVYAYDAGGTIAVGIAAFARMVPAGLAAPLAGLLADRYSRRDVLLAATAGRSSVVAAVAVAVTVAAPLALVLTLGALFTVVATAHKPAQGALLPSLAVTPRQLAASNAVWSAVDNGGFLVGSLLGGVLIAAASVEAAFAVTAILFALATLPMARIPRDPVPDYRAARAASAEAGPFAQVMGGFRTVAHDQRLRLVVALLAASTLVEGAVDVLVVVIAIQLLDLGGGGVGWLNSAWGIGGLVGGAAAIALLGRRRLAWGLALGALLVGLSLVLIAALPEAWMALLMLFVLGVGYALIEVAGLTLLQWLTSDEVLARAFAVVESTYWLTTGIGAVLAAPLVALLGLRGALVVLGVCLPLLVALRWAGLARLEATVAVPQRAFAVLRGLPAFAPLPLATLEALSRRLAKLDVGAGDIVIREGQRGSRFYVIADGLFEVTCAKGSFPSLSHGEFFGEIALLRDIPHTTTVRARTAGLLYTLDRESFVAAVSGHSYSATAVEQVIDARLGTAPLRTRPMAQRA